MLAYLYRDNTNVLASSRFCHLPTAFDGRPETLLAVIAVIETFPPEASLCCLCAMP